MKILCKQINPNFGAELESEEMKASLLHSSFTPIFLLYFAHAKTISFVTPVTCPVSLCNNGLVVIAVDAEDDFWLCRSR